MKVYITFGQTHTHSVNGKTFDKDCVASIEAPNHNEGRAKAFELFGPKFATSYTEDGIDSILKYFPRGIMEI